MQAGGVGHQSVAYILYYRILLDNIDGRMKSYVKISDCRGKEMLNHVHAVAVRPETAQHIFGVITVPLNVDPQSLENLQHILCVREKQQLHTLRWK